MNKTSLFAILGIVLAFTTALIFGSIVTPASAQGNTTVTMDNMTNMTAPMNNMSSMNMTMDNMTNMTAPMNNTSSMNMTMDNDTVVMGEPQVAPTNCCITRWRRLR